MKDLSIANQKTIITEDDLSKFNELDSFLSKYNPEQKKAIISDKKNILCIAGAGSGKTTVLIKRIEFLIKYRGVDPSKILAITFTRKARQEMSERLLKLNIRARVETFNSFSEKILQKYAQLIYNKPIRVMNYGHKAMAIMAALNHYGLNMKIGRAHV